MTTTRWANSWIRRPGRGRAIIAILIAGASFIAVLLPLVGTERTYPDWGIHLWLLWQQQLNLQALGYPTIYVSGDAVGDLYPMLAYAGGTLSTFGALTSLALGNAPVQAILLLQSAAVGASLTGFYLISRYYGSRGISAVLPGILYVTSAYYVSNIYGRGAYAESIATSLIPLLIGLALSFDRSKSRKRSIVLLGLLAVTSCLLFGSHTVTIVLTITLAGVFFIAFALCGTLLEGRTTVRITKKQLCAFVAVILGLALNFWFLIPAALTAQHTRIGSSGGLNLVVSEWFAQPNLVFGLIRTSSSEAGNSGTPALCTQIPTLALIWLITVAFMTVTPRRVHIVKFTVALIIVALLTLMLSPRLMLELPHAIQSIQFTYRLTSYVTLGICILTAASLHQASGRRLFELSLFVIAALSLTQAGFQAWTSPSSTFSRQEITADPTHVPSAVYATNEFSDASLPVLKTSLRLQPLTASRAEVTYQPTSRLPFASTVVGSTGLFEITGGKTVGVTDTGNLVLKPTFAHSPVRVGIWNSLTQSGWIATALAAVCLGALFVACSFSSATRFRR